MEYDALAGKYLRLRQELAMLSADDHRRRVLGDIEALELQLRRAGVRQFADTEPFTLIEMSQR